jgi:prepilin-type N-terminal cleavage/methylation domain-containing protein
VLRTGFSLVEILLAVTILTIVLTGTYSIVASGAKEASRVENGREISSLLFSAKACVESFGIPYARSVAAGTSVPVWFGTTQTECLTGATFTTSHPGTPSVELKGFFGEGGEEGGSRDYLLSFTSSTVGLPANAVKIRLSGTDGSSVGTLEFTEYGE